MSDIQLVLYKLGARWGLPSLSISCVQVEVRAALAITWMWQPPCVRGCLEIIDIAVLPSWAP